MYLKSTLVLFTYKTAKVKNALDRSEQTWTPREFLFICNFSLLFRHLQRKCVVTAENPAAAFRFRQVVHKGTRENCQLLGFPRCAELPQRISLLLKEAASGEVSTSVFCA